MALAANIKAPVISILRNEPSMNCFTAGWSEDDLVFGITAGGLSNWNRRERQAVVAHKLSHSYHGDCEDNLRLLAMSTGVASIAVTGMAIMESTGLVGNKSVDNDLIDDYGILGRRPSWGAAIAFGFGGVLYCVGYLGFHLASKLQLAVCRQHEFLADATAVQLTRDETSMADALATARQRRCGDQH